MATSPSPRSRKALSTGSGSRRLCQLLEQLAELYELGETREPALAAIAAVTRESVDAVCSSHDRSFSAINGDGLPVQVSVSLGSPVSALRILGEVGKPGMSMPARINATTIRLREVLSVLGLTGSAPAINHALTRLLPAEAHKTLDWTGGIWIGIAAAPMAVRLRVYVNQRWGSVQDRYLRIADLVDELQWSARTGWMRVERLMAALATPYGAAFDVTPGGIGCVKMYFACERSSADRWDDLLRHLVVADRAEVIRAVESMCGRSLAHLPPNALLPSIELTPHASDGLSLKLDVSCNHLGLSDVEQEQRMRELAITQAIDVTEYENVRDLVAPAGLDSRGVARIQYCGIGLARNAAPRLNIYFSPDLGIAPISLGRRQTMPARRLRL